MLKVTVMSSRDIEYAITLVQDLKRTANEVIDLLGDDINSFEVFNYGFFRDMDRYINMCEKELEHRKVIKWHG